MKAVSAEQKTLDQRFNQFHEEQRSLRISIVIGLVLYVVQDGLTYFFDGLKKWTGE